MARAWTGGIGLIGMVVATVVVAKPADAQPKNLWPPPPVPKEVRLEWGVEIPLRDGVVARVTVFRPADEREPLPVILLMTPYTADDYTVTARYFAQRGYVVVAADVRGRGNSGGEFKPFVQDGPDGYDMVEWLARQPWSNGKVGMVGLSYVGFTQWTTLKEFPPHLATIVPTAPAFFSYTSLHPYNIFSTYAIRWLTRVSGRSDNARLAGDDAFWNPLLWHWYSNHLPFSKLDSLAGNRSTEFATWLEHPTHDEYVTRTAVKVEDYPRIDLPILTVTGHFDSEHRGAMLHYRRHMRYGNAAAKRRHHLIIGPWDHVGTFWPRAEIGGLHFAPQSVLDLGTIQTEWYDWTLKNGPKPSFLRNRVAYYLMGAEEWRYADSLEAVTTEMRSFQLGSPGANPSTLAASGTLASAGPISGDAPDQWVYDPMDLRPGERELRMPGGNVSPADSVELFDAGLIYQTAPLAQPLDLAGYARFRVWLSMDVRDTDFQVTLYEVTADGKAIHLTQQLQRARYRESLEREKLVTPGEVTSFVLDDFDFFARRIGAGSRVRLVVGAINSVGYEKNYNSGGVVANESGKDARVARVMLYHDERHPSTLELPVAAPSRSAGR